MRTLLCCILLCSGFLTSCESGAQKDTFILGELAWVEDGRAEVEAYLRALRADRIYLTLRSPEEGAEPGKASPWGESDLFPETESTPDQLYLSIAGSDILNEPDQARQQAKVDWLALVIADNLADPYAYEELVIDLQAEDGSSLLYQAQPLPEILRREPRLRGE